jgi:Ca2+-binding EF-hand superfamily protein
MLGGAGFAALDKNGDGKITREELPERIPAAIFDRLDKNGDGALEASEMPQRPEEGGRPGGGVLQRLRPGQPKP